MNDIGISNLRDRARIRHLFWIGVVAALMVLAGDMLLGWVERPPLGDGLEAMVASYAHVPDWRLYTAAVLGLVGIPLEALCYFGIYRLFAADAPKLAHAYRAGILGYLGFGGCGVHVPCCVAVWTYKRLAEAGVADPFEQMVPWALWFFVPATVIFLVFFVVANLTQWRAFAGGHTPYPTWAKWFNLVPAMLCMLVVRSLVNLEFVNALAAGWISVGNLWVFGGLLATMPAADDPCWDNG